MEPGDIDTRPPYDGESLQGYVADIAGLNQLGRVASVAGDAGGPHRHRPQLATTGWDDLPALAELLEVDVGELRRRSYPLLADDPGRRAFFGTSVSRTDIRTRERYFSPAALAASPFHRAMWQLRIPFDTDTGEILVSNCPLCGQTQRWRHSAGIAFCDRCGESLDQPAERLDEDLLANLKLAVGLTHTDPARRAASLALLPNEIASLGPAMAFELLLRLVPMAEPACRWNRGDRIWRNDPHDIAMGMHGAWQILAGWRKAMTSRISRDIATADRRYSDGNRGATLRFLNLRDAPYLRQVLREIVQRLYDSIDSTGPHGASILDRTMTCVEVSKVLRFGTGRAVALRRAGVLTTIGVARGPGLLAAFDRKEVLEIARIVRRHCDLNRANGRLGLPYYAVEQLCALGRLPLLTHPFCKARFAEPQTTIDALDELVANLLAGRKDRLKGSMTIASAMHFVGGRLKPWDAVIEAMLAGELPYTLADGETPVFRRVQVRREDLLPYLQMPITRNGAITPLTPRIDPEFSFSPVMAKCDAAEVLNLRLNPATLLLADYPTKSQPSVPIEDVVMLAQQFVTDVELGARLNILSQGISRIARKLDIVRHCEAGYRRSEEGRLIAALTQKNSQKRRMTG